MASDHTRRGFVMKYEVDSEPSSSWLLFTTPEPYCGAGE